jgi:single-stranded DNA-binding protein
MNGDHERSHAMKKQPITLYGNLGTDPETHTLPEKSGVSRQYDPIIDEVVEKPYTFPGREVLRFTLAVNYKDEKEVQQTRWFHCEDREGLARTVRKGDRVKVTGDLQVRRAKDGRIFRNLTITSLEIEKMKVREQAA